MASSSLYPPIVAYSMPAFAVDSEEGSEVRVYFALSAYNTRSDFKEAHVTVRYQQNNGNALNPDMYKAQIKICTVHEVSSIEDPIIASTPHRFYITINGSDIIGGKFEADVTYKVQIRLSDINAPTNSGLTWFTGNLSHFSEWSTVCLIRGILKPNFVVVGLDNSSVNIC